MGESEIQHRHIIQIVSGSEGLFFGDVRQPLQLGQGRAFMIGRMAKSKVNRVSLVGEVREVEPFCFDESANLLHLLEGSRDDARKAAFFIMKLRISRRFQVTLYLLQ